MSAGEITERGSALHRSPDRRVPHARRHAQPASCTGSVRARRCRAASSSSRPELDDRPASRRPARRSASTSTSPTQANVVDVADRVIEAVDAARELPQLQGIEILVIAQPGRQHPRLARRTAQGRTDRRGARASCVLFFFLRDLPTTLIVSLAVPASLLITLARDVLPRPHAQHADR